MNIAINEITKELDLIYGIEEDKNKVLDYVKYLEISKENHFANYNIIIHNNSSYPDETKLKLIDFLSRRMNEQGIINSKYEFINLKQLRKNCQDEIKNLNLKSDLIIIDSERIGRDLENYRESIVAIIEEFKNKIFIIIDNGFCIGQANETFNKYFDWFFEIDRISSKNKKDYILSSLQEQNITIDEDSDYMNELLDEPFYKIKAQINHIILKCKINKITDITDSISKKYFNNKDNEKDEEETKNTSKNKDVTNINKLIGIENVKSEINKIVNYVKICKKRDGKMPCLHMCFTGNPGTGKTTVARIIGEIFKEENILSQGSFTEIHGRDLVGQYVGWTAKEVQRYVRRARGGVLFIDEAYSLNSDRRGSFEDEAIATLIKEMEDKRDDICIILAGYKNEMNELIHRNPGFESRIQFYIDFPNYNIDELYQIFKSLAKSEKYKISSKIKDEFEEKLPLFIEKENFSNGRFIRNLYEKVKMEQATRVSKNKKENINLIRRCDVEQVLSKTKIPNERKIKIGFC